MSSNSLISPTKVPAHLRNISKSADRLSPNGQIQARFVVCATVVEESDCTGLIFLDSGKSKLNLILLAILIKQCL